MGLLPVTVELQLGGVWTDVTQWVYRRDDIRITRGRSDWGTEPDPGQCTLTLDNRDGRFSPRNPAGAWYGQLGRNTPMRVSVTAGSPRLYGGTATAARPASWTVATGLDVRVDLDTSVLYAPTAVIAQQSASSTTDYGWSLDVSAGIIWFRWTSDGTPATAHYVGAYLPSDLPSRCAIRVVAVPSSSGTTATISWATSVDSDAWTSIPTGTSTATSIHASAGPIAVGTAGGTLAARRIQLLTPSGTVLLDEDFTAVPAGATAWTGTGGIAWTADPGAITARRVRFVGEVSEWPSSWDASGTDVYATVTAYGRKRRMQRAGAPLESAVRRDLTSSGRTDILAYWPLEDSAGSTSAASALPGGQPMQVIHPGITWAATTGIPGSGPLPTMGTGTLRGSVPSAAPGVFAIRVVAEIPSTGVPSLQQLIRLDCGGSLPRWELNIGPSGTLQLVAYDQTTTRVLDTGAESFPMLVGGGRFVIGVDLQVTAPSATSYRVYTIALADAATVSTPLDLWQYPAPGTTMTAPGAVHGPGTITIGGGQGLGDQVTLGHVSVADSTSAYSNTGTALLGWLGEAATARVRRVAAENALPVWVRGADADSQPVGVQAVDTALTVLTDAAEADGGVLGEVRDALATSYRSRATLYNQQPAVTLDYGTPGLVPPLQPTDDDQHIANDVTVTRTNGSSAVAVLADGSPMSVADPPVGVGDYPQSVSLLLATDDQAATAAGWLLHLGTVDEARWPQVTVDMERVADVEAAAAVDIWDALRLSGLPAWEGVTTADLVVEGYSETLPGYGHWTVTYNCTPGSVWRVAEVGDAELARADVEGSTLAAAASASATTLSVACSGALWATSAKRLTPNPDFELGLTGWTGVGGTLTRVPTPEGAPFSGDWSAQLVSDGSSGSPHIESAQVAVTPGGTVIAHAAMLTAGSAGLGVNWFNASGVYLSTTSIAVPGAPGWQEVTATVTVPSTAHFATINPTLGITSAGSTLVADVAYLASAADSAADFPFDLAVAGEVVRVTGCTGTSSPQSLTVIRAINGVSKPLPAGASVALAQPAIVAI